MFIVPITLFTEPEVSASSEKKKKKKKKVKEEAEWKLFYMFVDFKTPASHLVATLIWSFVQNSMTTCIFYSKNISIVLYKKMKLALLGAYCDVGRGMLVGVKE